MLCCLALCPFLMPERLQALTLPSLSSTKANLGAHAQVQCCESTLATWTL